MLYNIQYGEERFARRIARAIADRRAERPFENTKDLAELIAATVPRQPAKSRGTEHASTKHPATRSFQALRIAVNDEVSVF